MNALSFVRREWSFRRAAAAGSLEAAERLARELRNDGLTAMAAARFDGTVIVTLEGASIARQELTAMIAGRRRDITATVATAVSRAIKDRRS